MIDLVLVTLLVLALAALIVVALPEGLGSLAARNGRKWDTLTQRIRLLEQDLTHQQRQLSRFEGRASKRYRAQYDHIKTQLDYVGVMDRTLPRRDSLQFPQLPPNRWAGFYFAQHPGDALTVGRTFWRLRQIEAEASRCESTLQETDAGLDELETMPQHLQDVSRAAQERLTAVGQQLQTEQAWGLRHLDSMFQEHGRLRQEIRRLQGQLQQPGTISHDEAEKIDGELDGIESELASLEQQVSAVRQNREAYEAKEREALTAVQDLRRRAAAGGFPEELASLLSALANMLQDARRLAQNQAFVQAGARLADSQHLAEFGNRLIAVATQIQELQQRQNDALNRADIEPLSAQLQQVYRTLQQQLWPGGVRQASGVLETAVVQSLTALTGQLQELQTQAQAIDQQFRADVQRLEREANQRTTELDRAWNDMQRTLRLSDGELLAQRYFQSRQQREDAKGSPVRLDSYIRMASELTRDLRESSTCLQERMRILRESVNAISSIANTAEAEVGGWTCLQQQANEIRERATTVREIWPRVTQTGCLDKTHGLLDELTLYIQQVEQINHELIASSEQRGRLIKQTQEIIATLDDSTQTQVNQQVELRYGWAKDERDFAKAIAHLEDAKKIASAYEGW